MKAKSSYFLVICVFLVPVVMLIISRTRIYYNLKTAGLDHSMSSVQIDKNELARNRQLYGYASISPSNEVVAGSWGTWTLIYRAGRLGVDDGGRILVLLHGASDWGPFQMDNPHGKNYTTVRTKGKARLEAQYEPRYACRKPMWRGIIITVKDGYLQEGDEVILTIGDRIGGGPGSCAHTISQQEEYKFQIMVDPFPIVDPVPVLDSPSLRIISGKPVKLEALWPTEVLVGESTWLLVRAKDYWGNPSPSYRGTIHFDHSKNVIGLPESYTFTETDEGFHRFEGLRVAKAGTHLIRVKDIVQSDLISETNILVAISNSEFLPFWGDVHGQSGETGCLGTIESYFNYARGFSGIDFISWAGNDYDLSTENWKAIRNETKKHNQPGRFVAYLGYEWSANTSNGGDHNVLYLHDDQPIYRSSHIGVEDLKDLDADRYTVRELAYSLPLGKALLIPHVGGRRANLDFYQKEFMPLIEIYSGHGQFEWFLKEAMRRKLKVGFMANSDDIYSRPGESIPGIGLFAVHGGLTCVYARSLSRQDLWEALYKRRVYATTGERIKLRFTAGAHWMGEEMFTKDKVSFHVEATGTAGIERVDLFRNTERVYRYLSAPETPLNHIKIIWSGAQNKQRGRQTIWNGQLLLSQGRFRNVQGYRFDYPSEGIEKWEPRRVIWSSLTSGDEDGLIIDVEVVKNATLTFEAKILSKDQFGLFSPEKDIVRFAVPIRDLNGEDKVYTAGGLDRQVVIRRVASTYPKEIRFTWKENVIPMDDTQAYWVKIIQQDGAVAWSSPIFITRSLKIKTDLLKNSI